MHLSTVHLSFICDPTSRQVGLGRLTSHKRQNTKTNREARFPNHGFSTFWSLHDASGCISSGCLPTDDSTDRRESSADVHLLEALLSFYYLFSMKVCFATDDPGMTCVVEIGVEAPRRLIILQGFSYRFVSQSQS